MQKTKLCFKFICKNEGKFKMKVYLIRHSEPDFSQVKAANYLGYRRELTRLTPNGIQIAKKMATDQIFKEVEMLLISPYTRTLETALEITRQHPQIPTQIELALHEWAPDKNDQARQTDQEVKTAYQDFINQTHLSTLNFESGSEVRNRVKSVLDRYKTKYDCIAVVTHGIVIRQMMQLNNDVDIPYCGIYKLIYK